MFDNDVKKKSLPVPPNLPVLPEEDAGEIAEPAIDLRAEVLAASAPVQSGAADIFAETEKKEKPAAFQPVESPEHEEWGISEAEIKEQNKKKLTMLLGMFVVVVLLGTGAYFGLAKLFSGLGKIQTPAEENTVPGEEDKPVSPKEQAPAGNSQAADAEPADEESSAINPDAGLEDKGDNDRDGLTNEEEEELGTDPAKVDTDQDNLFDREEAKIYRTNPLDPDTDGDGFLDGEEVKAGYNPKGEGKLNVIRN